MIDFRKYQQTAREWCNRKLNQFRHPLIVMGAGTGKTKTAIKIMIDQISLKKRILVLVPQIEIMDQWIIECAENNISYGYINDEGVVGRNRDVYICMYQSLTNLLDFLPEKFVKYFNIIITDEAHRGAAESYRTIYNFFPQCLRMGLTASPYRMDNQPLGEFYTDLLVPITNKEAQKKGYLCEPVIIIPDQYKNVIPEDPTKVNIKEQREYVQDKEIIGDMVQVYKDVFNGLPIIIPCSGHQHAKNIRTMYQNAGWKVDHIHSNLSKEDRKQIIRRVKKGETNILISVGIGVEGMDIPGLFGIIWLRFTESLTIWIQFNGRAARPMDGKNYYILIDPMGNSVIHGRPDFDRKWSLHTDYIPGQDNPDDTTMRLCPVCGVMNAVELIECWICRYNFDTGLLDGKPVEKKKRKLPKMIDGNLVFLDEERELENIEGTEGNDENNNHISSINSNNRTNNNNCNVGNDSQQTIEKQELTKIEKMNILSKDLTGMRMRNKFRNGIDWL